MLEFVNQSPTKTSQKWTAEFCTPLLQEVECLKQGIIFIFPSQCIEDIEEDLKTELDYVKNNFNDIITYKVHPQSANIIYLCFWRFKAGMWTWWKFELVLCGLYSW